MLSHCCIPGMNPMWSWCIFSVFCFLVYYWGILHLCSLRKLPRSSFLGWIFLSFSVRVMLTFRNNHRSITSLSVSWKSLRSSSLISSLNFIQNSAVYQSDPELLFVGKVLITSWVSWADASLFRIFTSSWFSLGNSYESMSLSISPVFSISLEYTFTK